MPDIEELTEQTFNTRPRVLNTFDEVDRAEDSDREDDGLEARLRKLNEFIIPYLARLGEASRSERENAATGGAHGKSFTQRYDWETRKVENEVDVSWNTNTKDDDGNTLKMFVDGGEDAHCTQGLGAGLSQEAARHWIAYMNQKMFMINGRPFWANLRLSHDY